MSTADERTLPVHTEQKNVELAEGTLEQEAFLTPQDVETRLNNYLQTLFDLENLKSNVYLIHRLSTNLELHPAIIYTERNVQNICQDVNVIDMALEKVKGIQYTRGSLIKIKTSAPRRTVIVKNISPAHEQQFQVFVKDLLAPHNLEYQSEYNSKNQTTLLTFADEETAVRIFSLLLSNAYNGTPLDCLLKEENLYVELVENLKKNKRPTRNSNGYGSNYYSSYPQGYNNMYGQNMPMFMMPYPGQMFGKHSHYIRKSRDTMRNGHDANSANRTSNSTQESNDQNDQTQDDYSPNHYDGQENNHYSNSGSGYRSGKPYYKRRYNNYDDRRNNRRDNYQNRDYYNDNQEQRNYEEDGQQRARNYKKKILSSAEIERLTTVDADNYPPLA